MNLKHLIQPVLRIIAAIILLQTLFFKFSAAPESVYIFSKLGVEPWGRILSGCLELIVAVLLFVRSLRWFAALLGLGIMAGAILAHLTQLGIVVMNDGGELFFLALIVAAACAAIAWYERKNIPVLKNHFM
ncbi:MAG TPA: DoxX family protein [Bacteroidia bacterium]|nr:DoxX family protein [Bacteroidia bacterium]